MTCQQDRTIRLVGIHDESRLKGLGVDSLDRADVELASEPIERDNQRKVVLDFQYSPGDGGGRAQAVKVETSDRH